jgi:hypothetical protein
MRGGDARHLVIASRDLDGRWPFLDPAEPIPQDHVDRARKHFGLDQAEMKAVLDAMADRLGFAPGKAFTAGTSPVDRAGPTRGGRSRKPAKKLKRDHRR